jgi:tellurite resistance protein
VQLSLIKSLTLELKLSHYVMVMGWSGLYFCVTKLEHMHPSWPVLSELIAWVDVLVFLALSVGVLSRLALSPRSIVQELSQPVALCGAAAMAVAMILLSSVLLGLAQAGVKQGTVGLLGEGLMAASEVIWCWGAVIELALSLGVMVVYARLFLYQKNSWVHITPVLFIPAVGNVLVVLSGVALGHETWSLAQFVFGLTLWPLVCALLVQRLSVIGPLPLGALPSWCIGLSPPCVIGLALVVFNAPLVWVWVLWALGLGVLGALIPVLWPIRHQPYAVSFWAFSFPLAAWVSLSLTLLGSLTLSSDPSGADQALLRDALDAVGIALTVSMVVLMCYLSAKACGQARRFLSTALAQA